MFDLTQPVPNEVIVGSIVIIFALVGVGLGVVAWFKRKRYMSDL
ncbi:hypothetical protein MNB_SV-6-1507 [hydrothermal vent metagenome]|uniref:Uncharacterized protein n=1 Tax=hydrothermal vent metagenome TaxID=652676 RepID=A0A1W1CEG9_9ZZZZ